ncbi:MAG: hypothetical protein ACRYFA_14895 [Janthinobacterium lividum]
MRNFLFLILLSIGCFSCQQKSNENQSSIPKQETNEQLIARTKTSFKSVLNIHYTEVYRRFDNGVSFNAQGYQLKPSWKFYFVADTTVQLYSDIKKRYYDMPVTLDHDSLFSMGGAWFRARKISKDSLFFQVLSVKNKVISWKNSNVYVTFYAEDYLKNKLHQKAATLQGTTKKDTAYILALAAASAQDSKKVFAAQQPVLLKSNSPTVSITDAKKKAGILNNYYIPETLFYPEYEVTIRKAYADFSHAFAVKIDAKGQMHFIEPMEMMLPDEREHTIKIMKAIMEGYLLHYLNITPGKTLGIPHDSLILLEVKGSKS